MNEYEVETADGHKMTVQLDEETAERLGLKAVTPKNKQAEPSQNKQATPSQK